MSAVLHAPRTMAEERETMTDAPTTPPQGAPGTRRCPECLAAVSPSQAAGGRNMFCCAEHRATHANRMTVRGRRLTALAMAARITRDGSCRNKGAGKSARQLSRTLLDQWNREDREAGRMPADEYHALRVRLHQEPDPFTPTRAGRA